MRRLALSVCCSLVVGCVAPAPIPDAGTDAFVLPPPEVNGLDLLLMIDNSGSMAEEQLNLIVELPRLVRALVTGDTDGDGVLERSPVGSLHIGMISSDMGAGPHVGVPTCAQGLGDDGILRSRSRLTTAPCMREYPSGVFDFAGAADETDAFASTLQCVARLSTGGCSFEQQLEAALKAVSPVRASAWTAADYVPPRFVSADGEAEAMAGQADGPNAGFVRPESALAILLLTDEEDCSVRDYGLFVTADPRFMSVPLNLRCDTFGEPQQGVVHPVVRYVDGFIGLRRDPRLVVFSAIAGIPPNTETNADLGDFDAILEDPMMAARHNAMGTNLEPSCSTENGVAYPPIRMVSTARGLAARGARVSLSSICEISFEPAIDRFLVSLEAVFPPR